MNSKVTEPSSTNGPLASLKILAVEQFGAGPFGSLFLADMGAEVIKIENMDTNGDVGRAIPPHNSEGGSLYFESFNRGKKSISLNLKKPHDRTVFEKLVKSADAVFNNLRGDLPEKLGLTYESLKTINPKIVCVSLSGYGRTGKKASFPAYDALIQGESGWADRTGSPDSPPTKSGLSLVDYAGGVVAALGLVSKVLEARETNVGGDVDVDLYSTALSMYAYEATWFMSKSTVMERRELSAHPSIVPFQFFPTSDSYIAIACAKEKFFQTLVSLLDSPSLTGDTRFSSFSSRKKYNQELTEILINIFQEETTSHWVSLCEGKIPIAPVRSMQEALELKEIEDLGLLAEYDTEKLGKVRSVGLPIKFSDYSPTYSRAPELGEHDQDYLN